MNLLKRSVCSFHLPLYFVLLRGAIEELRARPAYQVSVGAFGLRQVTLQPKPLASSQTLHTLDKNAGISVGKTRCERGGTSIFISSAYKRGWLWGSHLLMNLSPLGVSCQRRSYYDMEGLGMRKRGELQEGH